MARRTRFKNRRDDAAIASVAAAYVKRDLPFFDPLNPDVVAGLEAEVDWILQEVGIAFRDDPKALEIWRKAGVKPEGDLIKVPADWIRALCRRAPSEFTERARNTERLVRIGGAHQVFAPIYGSPFVRDLKQGRRYGDLDSFTKLVKLVQMLPSLHHSGLVIVEPCDVPVSKRHLDMVYAHMRYTDKPHLGAITEQSRPQDSVDMAEILHGKDAMDTHCVILGNVNTNSPLLVDRVVCEAIRTYCGRGQGIIVVPFVLSDAMGPVSTAASIAQAMAEAMICCAFSQLVREGAPFVLGNFLSSMSLKLGAPTFGMPEPVLSNYVIGQMSRRLSLPLRCGGSLTASKIEDAQAAYESADSMQPTMLAGAHFGLHAAGWMEGGLCTGFEKLVMDADRLGAYQKFLKGLNISTEAFARDAYSEVKPGGHFLGSAHTMRNYQNAFYEPALSNSENVESWKDGGSLDMRQRANESWTNLLDQYEAPPLNPAIDEPLQEFVARRKSELPDAWY